MKEYFKRRITNTLKAHAEIVKTDREMTREERIEHLQILQDILNLVNERDRGNDFGELGG